MTPVGASAPLAIPAPAGRIPPARVLLVLGGLLVAAASMRSLRLALGGLLVPLHVIPIVLAVPTVVVPRLGQIPRAVRNSLLVFWALYAVSMLRYGEQFGDLVKMTTSLFTIFAVALMVQSIDDFRAATIALSVSLLLMNLNGLRGGFVGYVGYEPLRQIANKNAYSLYALPIVLLAGYLLLHHRSAWLTKLLMLGAIASTVFLLLSGANRSGWGGLLLIGAMLAVQARRWRALAALAAVGAASYGVWAWFGTHDTFEYRLEQTREGYSSDELRGNMVVTAFEIGLENPLLGLTPQELPFEMARRLETDLEVLDTHNFAAYIVGGSGFPTLLALGWVGVMLWRRPKGAKAREVHVAHDLVRMVCVLFILRGMFSREVFFVGPFAMALGLALGLTMSTASRVAPTAQPASRPSRNALSREAIFSRS